MILALAALLLTACSHHAPPQDPRLGDSIVVVATLNEQLRQWSGTPYRNGGMDRRGMDCSGFVKRTFQDRFSIRLPRTTKAQTSVGTRIDRDDLLPGDLVFFKTGSGQNGLHVGIYDKNDMFIHASTSRGVTRSSLDNVYWRKAWWQARRI
ncbi:putative lipoprotein NlpC [Biostraticola tofi]|uniref:Putative lipoprotein NlpC n=2 Tax=Biostraticola tofi TaxID=466109 RepID=A0A4R3Z3J7_9GAMM|nr:putative lipoprotein NlpC [Biostraticola tofi]